MLKSDKQKNLSSSSQQNSSQSDSAARCAKCNKSTRTKSVIACCGCGRVFDLDCANILTSLWTELNKHKPKSTINKSSLNWYCSSCSAKSPDPTNCDRSENSIFGHFNNKLKEQFDDFLSKLDEKLNELLDPKLEKFKTEVEARVDQMKTNFETRIAELERKYDDMKAQFDNRTSDVRNQEDKAERLKNLMCFGVPNENAAELPAVVAKICCKYDPTFDIKNVTCFRLKNAKGLTPPVMIKFATKRARDAVFFKYIKERDLKLSDAVDGADMNGRMFLNEHLTKEEATVVRQCRLLKQEKKIQRYVLRDGDIFIGFTENKKVRSGPIKDLAHLNTFIADK